MVDNAQSPKPKRTVHAPQPAFPPGKVPANRVISVNLDEDEEVAWQWTALPDGQLYVSGYTITRKSKNN